MLVLEEIGVSIMSNINVPNAVQASKHGACSSERSISGTSFSWGEDKALGSLVFPLHPPTVEGIELYFNSKEKVNFLIDRKIKISQDVC